MHQPIRYWFLGIYIQLYLVHGLCEEPISLVNYTVQPNRCSFRSLQRSQVRLDRLRSA